MQNKLPDTPWHIGYSKKEENDPRRHKSRCIFLVERICKNGHSGCFQLKCPGSSHCQYYSESMDDWNSLWKNTRSVTQEMADNQIDNWDRAKRAQEFKIRKMSELLKQNRFCFVIMSFDEARYCKVCDTKLVGSSPVKICPYCMAVYVKEGSRFSDDPSAFVLKAEGRKAKYLGKTITVNGANGKKITRQNVVPIEEYYCKNKQSALPMDTLKSLYQETIEKAGFSKQTIDRLQKLGIRNLGTLAKIAESAQLNQLKQLQKKSQMEILDKIQHRCGISFHDMYFGKQQ